MEILRKNLTLFLVGLVTFVFGVIAIATAIRLYQTAQEPIAPIVPQLAPAATTTCDTLTFTILTKPTLTSTPEPATPSATPTPKPTATPTQPKATPTIRPTATPTPPVLPQVGFSLPTLGGILAGVALLGLALFLAF